MHAAPAASGEGMRSEASIIPAPPASGANSHINSLLKITWRHHPPHTRMKGTSHRQATGFRLTWRSHPRRMASGGHIHRQVIFEKRQNQSIDRGNVSLLSPWRASSCRARTRRRPASSSFACGFLAWKNLTHRMMSLHIRHRIRS